MNRNTIDAADDIVRFYIRIRGYGPVKEEAIGKLRDKISGRLDDYVQP